MSVKKLRPLPGEPVPFRSTPRCCGTVSVQTEHEKQWRERRYNQGSIGVFQCTRPSLVEIDDKPYCRMHGAFIVLNKYIAGELVEKKP